MAIPPPAKDILAKQLISEFEGELESELALDEGSRAVPYLDTRGFRTIGMGWNLDAKPLPQGYAPPLTYGQQIELLRISIYNAEQDLVSNLTWPARIEEDARKGVLVDLCFNMGIAKLLCFHKMLNFLYLGVWFRASDELLNSQYAREVPIRAKRLANQLLSNQWAVPIDVA